MQRLVQETVVGNSQTPGGKTTPIKHPSRGIMNRSTTHQVLQVPTSEPMLRTKVGTIGGQQLLRTMRRMMMGMSLSASQRDFQLGILGQRVTRAKAKGMENTALVAKVTAKDAMEKVLVSPSGMHHLLQRQQSILRQKQSLDAVRVYVRLHGSMAVKVMTCCT